MYISLDFFITENTTVFFLIKFNVLALKIKKNRFSLRNDNEVYDRFVLIRISRTLVIRTNIQNKLDTVFSSSWKKHERIYIYNIYIYILLLYEKLIYNYKTSKKEAKRTYRTTIKIYITSRYDIEKKKKKNIRNIKECYDNSPI
ncbi:hypothetical protein V1477_001578 [Vespula maculifrons]|uniref:Uncharacterized protein n=1 Tax=Vespula maculifrons TaxID=7453 RepID=A0ABD2CY86_VESMC